MSENQQQSANSASSQMRPGLLPDATPILSSMSNPPYKASSQLNAEQNQQISFQNNKSQPKAHNSSASGGDEKESSSLPQPTPAPTPTPLLSASIHPQPFHPSSLLLPSQTPPPQTLPSHLPQQIPHQSESGDKQVIVKQPYTEQNSASLHNAHLGNLVASSHVQPVTPGFNKLDSSPHSSKNSQRSSAGGNTSRGDGKQHPSSNLPRYQQNPQTSQNGVQSLASSSKNANNLMALITPQSVASASSAMMASGVQEGGRPSSSNSAVNPNQNQPTVNSNQNMVEKLQQHPHPHAHQNLNHSNTTTIQPPSTTQASSQQIFAPLYQPNPVVSHMSHSLNPNPNPSVATVLPLSTTTGGDVKIGTQQQGVAPVLKSLTNMDYVDATEVNEEQLQELLAGDKPLKFDWEGKWLRGDQYEHMLNHIEAYCSAFGMERLPYKTHPDNIYLEPINGQVYFVRANSIGSDFGFPRLGIKKHYKWKKMNFTTDLPKRKPKVSYIVASANRCEKFFPGKSKEGPMFRMHAVILQCRHANGKALDMKKSVNDGKNLYICCHLRRVEVGEEDQERQERQGNKQDSQVAGAGVAGSEPITAVQGQGQTNMGHSQYNPQQLIMQQQQVPSVSALDPHPYPHQFASQQPSSLALEYKEFSEKLYKPLQYFLKKQLPEAANKASADLSSNSTSQQQNLEDSGMKRPRKTGLKAQHQQHLSGSKLDQQLQQNHRNQANNTISDPLVKIGRKPYKNMSAQQQPSKKPRGFSKGHQLHQQSKNHQLLGVPQEMIGVGKKRARNGDQLLGAPKDFGSKLFSSLRGDSSDETTVGRRRRRAFTEMDDLLAHDMLNVSSDEVEQKAQKKEGDSKKDEQLPVVSRQIHHTHADKVRLELADNSTPNKQQYYSQELPEPTKQSPSNIIAAKEANQQKIPNQNLEEKKEEEKVGQEFQEPPLRDPFKQVNDLQVSQIKRLSLFSAIQNSLSATAEAQQQEDPEQKESDSREKLESNQKHPQLPQVQPLRESKSGSSDRESADVRLEVIPSASQQIQQANDDYKEDIDQMRRRNLKQQEKEHSQIAMALKNSLAASDEFLKAPLFPNFTDRRKLSLDLDLQERQRQQKLKNCMKDKLKKWLNIPLSSMSRLTALGIQRPQPVVNIESQKRALNEQKEGNLEVEESPKVSKQQKVKLVQQNSLSSGGDPLLVKEKSTSKGRKRGFAQTNRSAEQQNTNKSTNMQQSQKRGPNKQNIQHSQDPSTTSQMTLQNQNHNLLQSGVQTALLPLQASANQSSQVQQLMPPNSSGTSSGLINPVNPNNLGSLNSTTNPNQSSTAQQQMQQTQQPGALQQAQNQSSSLQHHTEEVFKGLNPLILQQPGVGVVGRLQAGGGVVPGDENENIFGLRRRSSHVISESVSFKEGGPRDREDSITAFKKFEGRYGGESQHDFKNNGGYSPTISPQLQASNFSRSLAFHGISPGNPNSLRDLLQQSLAPPTRAGNLNSTNVSPMLGAQQTGRNSSSTNFAQTTNNNLPTVNGQSTLSMQLNSAFAGGPVAGPGRTNSVARNSFAELANPFGVTQNHPDQNARRISNYPRGMSVCSDINQEAGLGASPHNSSIAPHDREFGGRNYQSYNTSPGIFELLQGNQRHKMSIDFSLKPPDSQK